MTVQDLLTQSLNEIGVSSAAQGPNTNDLQLAFTRANLVLDGWNSQSDLLPYTSEVLFQTVTNQSIYDFATLTLPLAAKIDRVIFTDPATNARTDLERQSWAGAGSLSYNPSSAAGRPTTYCHIRSFSNINRLNLQPKPNAVYSILLAYWRLFTPFSSLNDTVDLPPSYTKLLMLQTALELAPAFEVDPARLAVTTTNWQNALASLKSIAPDGPRNPAMKGGDK